MKRSLLILFFCGGILLVVGSPGGPIVLALVLLTATIGVVSMKSRVFGPVRTTVPSGIALTYDDGPNPVSTPALLDLLKERNVKATFFVVGEKVLAHPEVVRRCHAEGHTIGNHSHRHGTWTNLHFGGWMRSELGDCQRAVESAIGEAPRFYRPPFGLMNPHVEPAARAHGMQVVGWSVRSLDTARDDAAQRVTKRLTDGAIVLLHDGDLDADRVVATTRTILDAAEQRGLTPVAL